MDSNSLVTSKFGVQKIGKNMSPVLPKVKDAGVNVRDRLNDVLLSEKHLLNGYQIGCSEVICEQLLNLVNQNMNSLKNIHRNVLSNMFDLGEYQADLATPIQVEDAWDTFNNYKVQLPFQNQSN
ncbi:MAG TPA: spore coat protein [Bacillota bacterium]|nr:spore coat protein [Bacillota bacterium]